MEALGVLDFRGFPGVLTGLPEAGEVLIVRGGTRGGSGVSIRAVTFSSIILEAGPGVASLTVAFSPIGPAESGRSHALAASSSDSATTQKEDYLYI